MSESSSKRPEIMQPQESPEANEATRVALDALLQISRGERMLGEGESLTGITESIVEAMSPAEQLEPVTAVVTKRLRSVLGETPESPSALGRGQALLTMAVIADRIRYTTNTTDTFAARLIGMNYFAGMKPAEAARIVGGENANLETVRSNLSIVLNKVRKKGWEELAPRLRALAEDPGAKPADFMGLHDEIAATATKVARRDRILGRAAIASRQKPTGPVPEEPFLEDEYTPVRRRITRDTLADYLHQIGSVKLLNKTTEIVLAKRIEDGLMAKRILSSEIELLAMAEHDMRASGAFADEIPGEERDRQIAKLRSDLHEAVREGAAARERFITANLRLVVTMAQRKNNRNVPLIELVQYGNRGLIEAVDGFDYTKGYKFSTYATWHIKKHINLGIHNYAQSTSISLRMFESLTKLMAIEPNLVNQLGRDPTVEELARDMELPVKKVKEVIALKKQVPVSMDATVGEDMTLHDVLADTPDKASMDATPEAAIAHDIGERIEHALTSLPERHAQMMRYRFGFIDGSEHNQKEVGDAFGVSKQRVNQIEEQVLHFLRTRFPELKTLLG